MIIVSSLLPILPELIKGLKDAPLKLLSIVSRRRRVCHSSQEDILTPPQSGLHALHSCGSVYQTSADWLNRRGISRSTEVGTTPHTYITKKTINPMVKAKRWFVYFLAVSYPKLRMCGFVDFGQTK